MTWKKSKDFVCGFCARVIPAQEFDFIGQEIEQSARLTLSPGNRIWDRLCCDPLRDVLKNLHKAACWGNFEAMINQVEESLGQKALSPEAERRAVDILLEYFTERFWSDFRDALKSGKGDDLNLIAGTSIRNCLRMSGFLDKDVPTGNLDDVWLHLASVASEEAAKIDWVAKRKRWPTRKMRTEIQGEERAVGERLWGICLTLAGELEASLQVDSASPKFNPIKLRKEALIVTMWIITQEVQGLRDSLEVMHDCFFHYQGIADESNPDNAVILREINRQYKLFLTARSGNPQMLLTVLLGELMACAGQWSVDASQREILRVHYLNASKRVKSISGRRGNPN